MHSVMKMKMMTKIAEDADDDVEDANNDDEADYEADDDDDDDEDEDDDDMKTTRMQLVNSSVQHLLHNQTTVTLTHLLG